MFRLHSPRGFTLIELLAVLAIIGILSSVIFSSLSGVRARSRDSARKQQLKEIQKALELYYAEYGRYPSGRGWGAWDRRAVSAVPGDGGSVQYWCFSGNNGCDRPAGSLNGPIKALVNAGYLRTAPEDPINTEDGVDGGSGWLSGGSQHELTYLYCSNFAGMSIAECNQGDQHYILGTNLESISGFTNSYGNYYYKY